MRILFLCTDSYGGYGGIALYNRDLIQALAADARCREIVVLPRVIRGQLQPMSPKVRFVASAAAGQAAYLHEVLRQRRWNRFDLVICGHVNLLPLARIVAADPLLLLYGIEAWKPLREPLSNRIVQRCRAVVSISELTCSRFLAWSHYQGPAHLLPNAIDLGLYGLGERNPELAARHGLEGKRVLLTVGRIVAAERYKGFDEILNVMPLLLQRHPDLAYLIAGGGNDLRRLKEKADYLGITPNVVFTGLFDESEKRDLYHLADVYTMPSRGEGFGFVFLEALACGVPAIGSRHDGGREALRFGELGMLVDPTSAAEIEEAVEDALTLPKAIPPGLEYFSVPRFAERVSKLLDEVT
jgi:phosphatidylinositol alpha-1,6-mannosyltransferase